MKIQYEYFYVMLNFYEQLFFDNINRGNDGESYL